VSIQRFSAVRTRNRIGLVEEDPTPEISTAVPGYEVYRCDDGSLAEPGRMATTAAVVFRQSRKRPRKIVEQLKRLAPASLWHGCLVFVQPVPVESGSGVQHLRWVFVQAIDALQLPVSGLTSDEFGRLGDWCDGPDASKLTPIVHVLERPDDWQGVLRYLQLCPPNEAPSSGPELLLNDSNGIEQELDPERQLLVQRAFWDSSEVRMQQLRNGLSGVDAYRVYAQQTNSIVDGSRPYRYFVKLGPRKKVATEYLRYRDTALEHLPYHLGPRLRPERCALGHRSGIIVSDYVSGAEPLRDCARDGRAVAVIANLFNVTFRAWHDGAGREDVRLEEHLRARVPARIPPFRERLIVECGAKKSLEELGELLLAGDSRPVRVGVIHGDLHATNVLVRGGDAILIDFEKVNTSAPLLRDLACLEGGLFVDGFVGEYRKPRAILASVERLYARELLHDGRVSPCHPLDGSAWFFDCVMQIRMQARQIELGPGQYALVLASELMRKACNPANFDAEPSGAASPPVTSPSTLSDRKSAGRVRMEQTRAMAYVLAERILSGLSDHVDQEVRRLTE
jgi:hypothetical protein